ncbi:DNA binding domain-containing protein, excisionase family [Frankineae bacterium MT45]|nr:DNA binding domain-containing protein, excisionase family [Frankineae bacterium MT45]
MTDHTSGDQPTWADDQLLLTPEQAAQVLHVGRTTLFALLRRGELHAVHIGRSCRVTRAELLRYVTHLDGPARTPTSTTAPEPGPTVGRPRKATNMAASQRGLFDLDPTSPEVA